MSFDQILTTPKVSVLLPVYRTKVEDLRNCIQSILDQSFTDFELLIVDDCPEDLREDVIKTFNDPRIKYYKNDKNLGISGARNKLIELSHGQYLAVCDHDDFSMKNRFELEVKYLDANPEIGVVSGSMCEMPFNTTHVNVEEDRLIRLNFLENYCLIHPACMIRKRVLIDNKVSYQGEYFPCEDYKLFCDLIPFTKFHNLKDVLIKYKDTDNTSSSCRETMTFQTNRIRAEVARKHPELVDEYQRDTYKHVRYRLFGLIPFLHIVESSSNKKVYLFGILILRVITRRRFY